MLAQFSERLEPQPRNLQLEIEKCPLRKLPQNIFQCGQRQALRRRVLDLHPSDGRVMTDHSLPIGGKPHVEFEPVAAVTQTELKRCQSIFRNLAESPSPTMPAKNRACHSRPATKGGKGQQELIFSPYSAISAVKVLRPKRNPEPALPSQPDARHPSPLP